MEATWRHHYIDLIYDGYAGLGVWRCLDLAISFIYSLDGLFGGDRFVNEMKLFRRQRMMKRVRVDPSKTFRFIHIHGC